MTCPLGRLGPDCDLVRVRVVAVGVTVGITVALTLTLSSSDRYGQRGA